MRNIIFNVAIIAFFIFIGCDYQENTPITITNNTSYDLLDVNFTWDWGSGKIYNLGNINSKKNVTIQLLPGGFGIHGETGTGTITFILESSNGNPILCTIKNITIKSNYKNEYLINNNTTVSYSNNNRDTIQNIAGPVKTATLIINNMTDYNFLNVEYDSVNFGNINSGRDSRKNVSPGTKFIYFNLQPKSGIVRLRTEPFTSINGNNTITITNNTIVTVLGDDIRSTVKSIFDDLNK